MNRVLGAIALVIGTAAGVSAEHPKTVRLEPLAFTFEPAILEETGELGFYAGYIFNDNYDDGLPHDAAIGPDGSIAFATGTVNSAERVYVRRPDGVVRLVGERDVVWSPTWINADGIVTLDTGSTIAFDSEINPPSTPLTGDLPGLPGESMNRTFSEQAYPLEQFVRPRGGRDVTLRARYTTTRYMAFEAELSGGALEGDRRAIVTGRLNDLRILYEDDQPPPGLPERFSSFDPAEFFLQNTVQNLTIDDNGRVIAQIETAKVDQNDQREVFRGLWTAPVEGASLVPLLLEGDAAPGIPGAVIDRLNGAVRPAYFHDQNGRVSLAARIRMAGGSTHDAAWFGAFDQLTPIDLPTPPPPFSRSMPGSTDFVNRTARLQAPIVGPTGVMLLPYTTQSIDYAPSDILHWTTELVLQDADGTPYRVARRDYMIGSTGVEGPFVGQVRNIGIFENSVRPDGSAIVYLSLYNDDWFPPNRSGFFRATIEPGPSCSIADLTSTGVTRVLFDELATPDGIVDLDDLGLFLDDWLHRFDRYADITTTGATLPGIEGYRWPDGAVDLDDLAVFLNHWLAGCN